MNKFKELREWANLLITIAGPVFIAWGIWSLNTKLDNQRMAIEAKANETYVTKGTYDADRSETNKRLDSISANVETIKIDIAKMEGRQGRNNNN